MLSFFNNMRLLFISLSGFLYSLSILNPAFYPPWSSFLSEYLSFIALLCLLPILFKKSISIPLSSFFILLISCIPIVQYLFHQVYYLDTAFLSFFYLFSFWIAVIIGFDSVKNYKYSLIYFYSVILICGLISSLIAIGQWLPININSDFLMRTNGRPFANMAQPNHLSTFLILSLISCLYLFENKILNNNILTFFTIILLFTVALTQSRTAWIIFLFLSWLYFYKGSILRINYKIIGFYLSLFTIFSIIIPILKEFLLNNKAISILDRVYSGHERLQIWQQAVEAIRLKPLNGYGWNQSYFAQFDTIKNEYIKHKLTSFHNIFLDILVWCGIPLGLLIIIFFSYLLINSLIRSISSDQIYAEGFIFVILIHSLFEYPLSYSYFLLPLGFLLGFILFNFKSKVFKIPGFLFTITFILGIFISFYIFWEYSKVPDNMVAAETHEMNEKKDFIELPYTLHIFKTFEYRAKWISLYPCTELSEKKIRELEYMVKTYIIYYDLYKFSKILYYNGQPVQAERYLNILNYIYNKNYTLKDLKCSI